uniref:S9 family peptidase n=2 Tax=Paracidobacterium acidisoli TaxID=2303751 RepID=A0A372IT42_9BACT
MPYNTANLVYGAVEHLTWLPAQGSEPERFWYSTMTPEGARIMLVDPSAKSAKPAFDHTRIAAALSKATGQSFTAGALPLKGFDLAPGAKTATFQVDDHSWKCDLASNTCASDKQAETWRKNASVSPDGKRAVFIRNWNLWVRNLSTGQETQLTTDGVKDFGYATDNAGWSSSDNPVVVWSPDSKKVATYQQDQRGDGEMYLVDTRIGHPHLRAWKYPLPGDAVVTTIQRVVIDVDVPRVVRFRMPPDQHRSTLCDDLACHGGDWQDVQWSPDSAHLAFISTSRDHKQEWLRIADAATGEIRDVMQETVKTFYESGNGKANWKYLPQSNEVIWFSERDNWGQLYLYALTTGRLKNQITRGEGNVAQMISVDPQSRTIWFIGNGREPGRDPYYRALYSIRFDGSGQKLLSPEDADHDISASPSGRWFADSYSTPDRPGISVVRDTEGHVADTFSKTGITKLLAAGWVPPVPFTVKARDGVTDLYGLMFKPSHFDPSRKYPIVNHIYPGPQTGSVGTRSFRASRGDCQALAELGFIVIELDGMGTPWRSKKFHETWYGNMGDNTLPDQITGMKQLAQRYPWIDLSRAGIYGHSGGGNATADAMFQYPDFFKAGIAESGNHDNREYEDDWGEKWIGLLDTHPDGTTNYDNQANENIAKNLKGHLLLAHGTMDNNVPPYSTLLVVDALIRANKDFDLLLLPNQKHGYGPDTAYMTRRRWDYFVRYLMGAEPPFEYEMHPEP